MLFSVLATTCFPGVANACRHPAKYRRYLKANQMFASEMQHLRCDRTDRRKYEARREALLKEIAQTEEKLPAADLDPEIIRTVRYQVEKVTEAGGIPEKKESVLVRPEQLKAKGEEKKREELQNKGKPMTH